ncbi:phosphoribosylanthranilate isomerase [Chloroflexota bacterium]
MHSLRVKICGLREEEHVIAAAEAAADYIGFVFAPSKRQVTPERARELVSVLKECSHRPQVVGVFVNEPTSVVNHAADYCGLDAIQLSGYEYATYARLVERPVICTVHVAAGMTADDVDEAICRTDDMRDSSGLVLLDTGSKEAFGGTGLTFDWDIAREVSLRHQVLIGGGLTPANVGQLITYVRPFGVDVSSGVERDGRKDASLIWAFVCEARKAEQENNDADSEGS